MSECSECGAYVDDDGMLCDDCDDVDAEQRAEANRYAAETRASVDAERKEDAVAFGRECKTMMDLLAVHGLPSDWADAKDWVRLFDGKDATHRAAPWIEAGWTCPGDRHDCTPLQDAQLVGDAGQITQLLASVGLTPDVLEEVHYEHEGRVMPELAASGRLAPEYGNWSWLDYLEHLKDLASKGGA